MIDRAERLLVRPTGEQATLHPISGSGPVRSGPLEVELELAGATLEWSLANRGDHPLHLDAVALCVEAGPAPEPTVVLVNGYQSWSPTGARVLGQAEDPSRLPTSIEFFRTLHHADPGVADVGELRSELVTVIRRAGRPDLLAGFLGGATHEGTVRVRRVDGRLELRLEAWLGGAEIPPGASRRLHAAVVREGDDPHALLDAWAGELGRRERARTDWPYRVGWCSWYHYFHDVSEEALRGNLARADAWPLDVFQVDDGYQAAIGDWLTTAERFPSTLDRLADDVAAAGLVPGIWLAPFLAAPSSELARAAPEMLARGDDHEPLVGMWNPAWGGLVHELDTTSEAVLEHLERLAASLVAMGWRYLKLDFTFSPTVPGRYADPTRTPAERVRAGYEAIRRGAGDDVFVLGCGCPLGAVVGVVDGMRIGPDVAPRWEPAADELVFPGYEHAAPSTHNAWRSTLARSFLHRRLWLNDPDCLMLRDSATELSAAQRRAWALAVGQSGGLALLSDDLALLDGRARTLLDEVVTLGRAADEAARTGPAPRCDDLLDVAGPRRLSVAGRTLVGTDDEARLETR